ncbi:MAG: hypothetical protein U5K76_15055 [Woeseiaceae bacterium]|nr:hypothetical protein [Woeseiaceae bacterium]
MKQDLAPGIVTPGSSVGGGLLAAANVLVWDNFDAMDGDALGMMLLMALIGSGLVALLGSAIFMLKEYFLRTLVETLWKIGVAGAFGAGYPVVTYVVVAATS